MNRIGVRVVGEVPEYDAQHLREGSCATGTRQFRPRVDEGNTDALSSTRNRRHTVQSWCSFLRFHPTVPFWDAHRSVFVKMDRCTP